MFCVMQVMKQSTICFSFVPWRHEYGTFSHRSSNFLVHCCPCRSCGDNGDPNSSVWWESLETSLLRPLFGTFDWKEIHASLMIISLTILLWLSKQFTWFFSLIASIPEAKKVILEALATTVKRSLEFLRVQHPGSGDEWVEVEWCEQESVSC